MRNQMTLQMQDLPLCSFDTITLVILSCLSKPLKTICERELQQRDIGWDMFILVCGKKSMLSISRIIQFYTFEDISRICYSVVNNIFPGWDTIYFNKHHDIKIWIHGSFDMNFDVIEFCGVCFVDVTQCLSPTLDNFLKDVASACHDKAVEICSRFGASKQTNALSWQSDCIYPACIDALTVTGFSFDAVEISIHVDGNNQEAILDDSHFIDDLRQIMNNTECRPWSVREALATLCLQYF